MILLSGSVRPSDLSRGVDRALLDLPVEPGRTTLSLWHAATREFASAAGLDRLPVRVVIDRSGREPAKVPDSPTVTISIEREPAEFRGTGGLLRDLTRGYAPDDLVLVGNGAQVLVEPLSVLTADLFSAKASVAIVAHRDGTPSGLFLVRCNALAAVPDLGFMDFKEQLLPRLAAQGHAIRVIHREHGTGFPLRTLDGYLAGLRALARRRDGLPVVRDPFSEDWTPTFSLVEPGARVDGSAIIHDSVILSGATVERGGAAVRCVVCPGAVVRAGRTVADQIVIGRAS